MKKLIICLALLILLQALSGCIAPPKKEEVVEEYVLKAKMKIEPKVAYPNETINFDASASLGDIKEYWWNFNLTNPAIGWQRGNKTTSHRYDHPAIYKVALRVIDKEGNESSTTDFVYINYLPIKISGKVEKRQKNDTYILIDSQMRRAVITLKYEPSLLEKRQLENLDLSVKVKYEENYTYVKSDNTTTDNGKAKVELTQYDIIKFNAYGDWYAEVYYNTTAAPPVGRREVKYNLTVELYYNS